MEIPIGKTLAIPRSPNELGIRSAYFYSKEVDIRTDFP